MNVNPNIGYNPSVFIVLVSLQKLLAGLMPIYTAASEEAALAALDEFEQVWGTKYPPEIHKIIYTTNAVEGFHRMLRKITKTKTSYPTDDSLKKSIFLAISEISKKWNNPIQDWGIIEGQLMVFFDDRISLGTAI